uniref:Uncharacterized protein n=1 Tax=Candidatus Kentrum sp. DK TaxID=2126562 RepID=A0A450S3I9_9GAMM|nr:MAG: hypothetical protein BECKDK2373C_GA0170839_101453 [Candidatus Kentron sp. DK]
MQAIEMEARVTNNHEVVLNLPESIKQGTVKVIIMYDKEKEASPQKKERQFGQFKEPFFMADDFDNELPDAVWLGEQR